MEDHHRRETQGEIFQGWSRDEERSGAIETSLEARRPLDPGVETSTKAQKRRTGIEGRVDGRMEEAFVHLQNTVVLLGFSAGLSAQRLSAFASVCSPLASGLHRCCGCFQDNPQVFQEKNRRLVLSDAGEIPGRMQGLSEMICT